MSGKNILRLLLISYGFCRDISIETYYGDYGAIGYDVSAMNDDGEAYSQIDCEGLLFHIYEINKFMVENHIEPRILSGLFSTKDLLSDESLGKILSIPENKNYCKSDPYCDMRNNQKRSNHGII